MTSDWPPDRLSKQEARVPEGRWFSDADYATPVARSPQEVIDRMFGLVLVTVVSQTDGEFTFEHALDWMNQHQLPDPFTPAERSWLEGKRSERDTIQMTWRTEAAWVLAWALCWTDELGPFEANGRGDWFYENMVLADAAERRRVAALRPAVEIWEAFDLVIRTHWAIRHYQSDLPDIDTGVVMERHWAFEWLTDAETPWDDVSLST